MTPTSSTPLLQQQLLPSHGLQRLLARRRRQKRHLIHFWPILIPVALFAGVAFLAWDVSSLGNCIVAPLCKVLGDGRGIESGWWDNQGPYAPYRRMGSGGAQVGLPRGCEVDQVTLLHRHTARYPTSAGGEGMLEALKKIRDREVRMPRHHPELAFLSRADFDLKSWKFDGLTDQGRKAAWYSGGQIASQYKNFLGKAEKVFIRSSGGERVVETSGYWLEGFQKRHFKLKVRSELPTVDLVVPEANDFNSTLCVHTCPAFQDRDPSAGSKALSELFVLLDPTLDRLNNVLRPQPRLHMDDLVALSNMCGFDSQVKGTDWKAWSKWCGLFTQDEWDILGYGKDVQRFYEVGQGSEYGPTMGAGYINEIIARLTDSTPVDNTITNRTLDGDEHTFPRGGKTFFVDFGHDNEILEIIAALGILKQHRPLPTDQVPPKRTYTLSHIVPFGARLTFERIACDTGYWEPDSEEEVPDRGKDGMKDYVRILVNDEIHLVSHLACEQSGLAEHGLCEVDSFIESQYFATDGVDWGICYGDSQP